MARFRRFVAAGINVALQEPHTPDLYAELIQAIFSLRRPIRVRGDQHIMISSIMHRDESSNRVEGTLARFTEIDLELPWFDLDLLDQAEDTDRQSIQIPERLRPNFRSFLFYFDLSAHVFVFEQSSGQQSLSVANVQRFLTQSVQDGEVVNRFGAVSISIIQADDALDVIFGLSRMKWLRIVYQLPNPDDHASLEAIMKDRFQAIRARKMDITLEGDPRTGIDPNDPEVRSLAQSALRNGRVEARGYDSDQQLITASSEQHPKFETESFDPDATSEVDVLRHAARKFSNIQT